MTDIMSEQFGRDLNARTTFKNEPVWLPLLSVHGFSGGETTIRGKTFTDCRIQGPALVAVMGSTTFEGCNMGRVADPRSLTFAPKGPLLVGAIGLQDCTFIRCEFDMVGFTGPEGFAEDFAQQLLSASEAQA